MRSFDTTNQALNVAIKVQTCRQFVDFIDPGPSLYFIHQKEQKREKNSSHFRFRFDKQVAEFTAQEFPELFCSFAKVCQVLYMDFGFIPSPNFRVLENGRTFLDYK